jgi:hypothetical protein
MNNSEGSELYFDYWNNETLLLVDLEDVFLNPHLHPVTQVSEPGFFSTNFKSCCNDLGRIYLFCGFSTSGLFPQNYCTVTDFLPSACRVLNEKLHAVRVNIYSCKSANPFCSMDGTGLDLSPNSDKSMDAEKLKSPPFRP